MKVFQNIRKQIRRASSAGKKPVNCLGIVLGLLALSVPNYLCVYNTSASDVPVCTYRVINTYPHDPTAFTQGLAFEDGFLYEGTGLCGYSSLRKVELKTGNIVKICELQPEYFGEGITIYEDFIIQLTYQNFVGFVYDKYSFKLIRKFTYSTEGWGITHDGNHIIMSDGTSTLYFLDPGTFEEISRITVHDSNGPVEKLNELEYVQGEIYANVWRTDRIARIDPDTGQIIGWIDLRGLLTPDQREKAEVLNGIAYDQENDRLFVTGKWWPYLFEIELFCPEHSADSMKRFLHIEIV